MRLAGCLAGLLAGLLAGWLVGALPVTAHCSHGPVWQQEDRQTSLQQLQHSRRAFEPGMQRVTSPAAATQPPSLACARTCV